MKSSMLEPSRRNSGLLAMSKLAPGLMRAAMTLRRARLVPTGTVLLVTMTL